MSLFGEYVYTSVRWMLFCKTSEDVALVILEVFVSNVAKANFKKECHIACRSRVPQLSNCGKARKRQSDQRD